MFTSGTWAWCGAVSGGAHEGQPTLSLAAKQQSVSSPFNFSKCLMLMILQQMKTIASGAVVAGEMEGLSWRESSCFFQGQKLELDVCGGKGGGGCAGLEEQHLPWYGALHNRRQRLNLLRLCFFNIYQALLAIPLVISCSPVESGFGFLPG